MATASSKPSAEMANTIVSYAQAAKGKNAPPAQSNPQPVSSPALSSQTKDDAPPTNPTSTAASSVTTNDIEARDSVKASQSDVDSAALKQDATEVASVTGTSSSTVSALEKNPKQLGEGEASIPEPNSHDDKARSSSRTSRSNDGADSKKARKGKKGRTADKDADMEKSQELEKEIPKPVLTEAKPPMVNIWVQRAEAQQAKTKVTPVSTPIAAQGDFPSTGSRRGPADEIETPGALTNGVNGDKLQRRPVESSRAPEQAPRRAGPRGARANDKDEKVNGYVPSVADATLWPDPKSAGALEEEKKKAQEKPDRVEKESQVEAEPVKAQKQKWEKVDFVPTVAFSTPLPPRNSKPRAGRGGREAGGSRGGHGSAASSSTTEKTSSAGVPGGAKPNESHQRDSSVSARGTSLPPSTSKRTSVDATHQRDQRKPSGAASNKDANADLQAPSDSKTDGSRPARGEYGQVNPEAPSFPPRNDRRTDFAKDQAHQGPNHQPYPAREGRGDRGRGGGFRRGGHNGPIGPHAPQGAYPPPNGQYSAHVPFPGRQNGPYSPPPFQTTFPNSFGPNPGRGGRGNGRGNTSGSVPGRSSSNGHGFPPKLPQFSPGGHYDYSMQQFAPYNYPMPSYEPSLLQIAQAQIEYYVSINNLCKDRFLRSHMNDDGWVDLSVVANFKRMIDLTKGDREIVRTACLMSEHVEVVVGDDGIERLRARHHWNAFTLPDSDRVPEARGSLSQNLYPVPRPPPVGGPYQGHMMPSAYNSTSPTGFAPGFPVEEQMFRQGYINGAHFDQPVNGLDVNGHPYPEASQLSATVPEFSPNGTSPPLTLDSMTNFTDAKVEHLMMLVEPSKSAPHGSNGSVVNGAVLSTDDSTAANGSTEDGSSEVQSPPTGAQVPNISWANDKKSTTGDSSESYLAFRTKALEERRTAKPGETSWLMRQLYEFWAIFLVANFNAKMYDEFRSLAIEDANQNVPRKTGLKHLLRYYNSLFYGEQPKPWGPDRPAPEIFTLHYQEADGLNQGVNGDLRA